MVVDDDLGRRYALAQLLRLEGYQVHSASGHESWLALFKSCLSVPATWVSFVAAIDPDVLLMAVDAQAALLTIGALRHHPLTDQVPVIALGDQHRPEDLATAMALGAAGSLGRPIAPDELCTQVARVLAEAPPRRPRTGDETRVHDLN
ncbi:MAG: response regulator [Myxococcales bacterium]|nr:response regulator [Myxococcales bacterium]